jgi:hypothetical protein
MARNMMWPIILVALIPATVEALTGFGGLKTISENNISGNEMSCKVTELENVKDTPNEFLIHTDGCRNSLVKEHVFRADRNELAASFTDPTFTINDFYNGVAEGGMTYDFDLHGMTVKPLGLTPKVVKVTKGITT